jgi:hypothetical protein
MTAKRKLTGREKIDNKENAESEVKVDSKENVESEVKVESE